MADDDPATVLVVDDEARVAEAFAVWLDGYDVRTATGGREALDAFDAAVDVVLLDRRMPGMSGDEVLERLRADGHDPRVAMVTGVDPEPEIAEMPFDDYVVKPVDAADLRETVERLVRVDGYDERVREPFALSRERATLAADQPRTSPDDGAYAELEGRIDRRLTELDGLADRLDPDDFESVFRGLDGGSGGREDRPEPGSDVGAGFGSGADHGSTAAGTDDDGSDDPEL
jgi:DNA-binding response OmpR family regulator